MKDHPHACGDKHYSFSTVTARLGSSPRVWGQENYSPEKAETTGIIPTRVGTSSRSLTLQIFQQDHPHACGDKGR